MSIFKCLTSIIELKERLQWDFLWQGKGNKKKSHPIDWSFICKPKKEGGLGFRPLKQMNQMLLGKWLWRIGGTQIAFGGRSLWQTMTRGEMVGISLGSWLSYKFFWLVYSGIVSVNDLFNFTLHNHI